MGQWSRKIEQWTAQDQKIAVRLSTSLLWNILNELKVNSSKKINLRACVTWKESDLIWYSRQLSLQPRSMARFNLASTTRNTMPSHRKKCSCLSYGGVHASTGSCNNIFSLLVERSYWQADISKDYRLTSSVYWHNELVQLICMPFYSKI